MKKITTVELKKAYVNAYDNSDRMFVVLRAMGGNPDKIIDDLAERYAESADLCGAFSAFAKLSAAASDNYPEDVHNALLGEIKRLYFSELSRDAAVAVGNAIGIDGAVTFHTAIPELTFSAFELMDQWNKYNPDKQPIRLNAASMLSI